jgi:hypothetical protein
LVIARNQFLATVPCGAERKIKGDNEKYNNGNEPDCAFKPPAKQGKNWSNADQVDYAHDKIANIFLSLRKVAHDGSDEINKSKEV